MSPNDDSNQPLKRKSVPTPYVDHDDVVVMIDAEQMTRIACMEAAIEVGMRPIATNAKNVAQVATTLRPLVIVAEVGVTLSTEELTDLAVSVGAQLVLVNETELPPALAQRVRLSGMAARALRARSVIPT